MKKEISVDWYYNLGNVLLQKSACCFIMNPSHPCSSCSKVFDSKQKLYLHVNRTHTLEPLICSTCNKSFARKDILARHISQHHRGTDGSSLTSVPTFSCDVCLKTFGRKDNLLVHVRAKHTDFKSGKSIIYVYSNGV